MKIGFIGLGVMGQGMVGRLLDAGFMVTVWNRSQAPVKAALERGAKASDSPVKLAKASDILVTMLPDDNVAHEVLVASGALEALAKDAIHVNMATVSAGFSRGMSVLHRRLGSHYVAAPVLGRPDIAAAGKLNILAAGDPEARARIEPVLAAMGQKIWPLGDEPERASVVKIAANFMLATAIESMGEASALTEAHGVGRDDFLDIVTSTLFASPAYQGYGKMIREASYVPAGMKMAWGLKDVELALQASHDGQVPLPFAGVLRDSLLEAIARGDGDKDWCALAETPIRRAHLDRR